MTKYYCNFVNNTKSVWTMAVYQTLPNSVAIGLDSVAWKLTTAPKGGHTGVSWKMQWDVALAEYKQVGGKGVYTANQVLPAGLGEHWKVIFEDGVQQLEQVGKASRPDQIIIDNKSKGDANIGIGLSGSASVFKRGVNVGASGQFVITPTYHAALFNNVEQGEIIQSDVVVGPMTLQYPDGENAATVTASLNGDEILLHVGYGEQTDVQQEEVEQRIKVLEQLKAPA